MLPPGRSSPALVARDQAALDAAAGALAAASRAGVSDAEVERLIGASVSIGHIYY